MLPLSIFMWYLIDLVQNLNFDVQVIIKRFTDTIRYIERTTNLQIVSEKSVAFITAKGTAFVNSLMSGINNAAINLFTTILLLFFLLAGGVRMEIGIARCLPFSDSNKHTIINKVSTIVRSNAIGIPLLALIQGGVASVGYWICGVNNPIEFGVLTGFASMIPIVGSMLVWIPLAIVQYFEQGLAPAIYIALYGAVVISQCDNVLRMFMQKRMANTHPLITIFGVIAGLPLFGFMGLIFGPLLVAMFLLFLEMFIKQYIIGDEYYAKKAKDHNNNKDAYNKKHDNQQVLESTANYKSQMLNSRAQVKQNNKQALLNGSLKDKEQGKNNSQSYAKDNRASADKAHNKKNEHQSQAQEKSSFTSKSESSLKVERPYKKQDKELSLKANDIGSGKSKFDFKTSKAESKQLKREAARIRAQEEKAANERELARRTLSEDRQPINLANRSLNNINNDAPGKTLVARAVSQALNSFDKFDDLEAFGGAELFKDEFLSKEAKEQIAKKHSKDSKAQAKQQPIPFVMASDQSRLSTTAAQPSVATKDQPDYAAKPQGRSAALQSAPVKAQDSFEVQAQAKDSSKTKVSSDAKPKAQADNKQERQGERKPRYQRKDRSERNKSAERSEQGEHNARNERSKSKDHNARKDKAQSKSSNERRNKKGYKSSAHERTNANSTKNSRNRKGNDSKKSRHDNLGYQTMRSERHHPALDEPVIRTVVSHQYGNMDFNKSRSTGLKTQLVSMHTAKGTVMAQPPRRRPSKRRPYH